MERIIQSQKSIIVAADVPNIGSLVRLAEAMKDIPGIGGFKIGSILAMQDLAKIVNIIRQILGLNFPIIYDHQKAGNDIPDIGKLFAEVLKKSGVNAAILFPFAGPATQRAWTIACLDVGLKVITGGMMTHPQFLASEGGYFADKSVKQVYRLACELGVKDFVVPGNKIDWVIKIRSILNKKLGYGNFTLYAPGFITQKGDISECGQAAGDNWHAIVGSYICNQLTPELQRQAAITATSQIIKG